MVDSLDNVIENAYEYGRTGIETYVDQFLKDADKEQRRKLKQQILVIWDRIIQYWMDKKTDKTQGPSVSPVAITDSIGEIVYNEGIQHYKPKKHYQIKYLSDSVLSLLFCCLRILYFTCFVQYSVFTNIIFIPKSFFQLLNKVWSA